MDAKGISSTEPGAHRMLERMLFLSDGVFAIVMTLLVLDLRVPPGMTDAGLLHAFVVLGPKLSAFATSFVLVSVFWVAHASITRDLQKFDWPVAWANLAFLFALAWAPFAATLLGEFGTFGNAWRFYCLALIVMGSTQVILLLVISRDHGRLLGGLGRRQFWYRLVRAGSPSVGFSVALAVSLAGLPQVSYFCWILIPVTLIVARLLFKPDGDKTITAPAKRSRAKRAKS